MKRNRTEPEDAEEQQEEFVKKKRRLDKRVSEASSSSDDRDEDFSGEEVQQTMGHSARTEIASDYTSTTSSGEEDGESNESLGFRGSHSNSSGESDDETGSEEDGSPRTDLITRRRKKLRFKYEPNYHDSSSAESENEKNRGSEEEEDGEEESNGEQNRYVATSRARRQQSSVGGKTLPGQPSVETETETIVISSSEDEKENNEAGEKQNVGTNEEDAKNTTVPLTKEENAAPRGDTSTPADETATDTSAAHTQTSEEEPPLQPHLRLRDDLSEEMETKTELVANSSGEAEPLLKASDGKEDGSVQSSLVEEEIPHEPVEKNSFRLLLRDAQEKFAVVAAERTDKDEEEIRGEEEKKNSSSSTPLPLPRRDSDTVSILPIQTSSDTHVPLNDTVAAKEISEQQGADHDNVLLPVEGVSSEAIVPEKLKGVTLESNGPIEHVPTHSNMQIERATDLHTTGGTELQGTRLISPNDTGQPLAEGASESTSAPRSKYNSGRWGLATEILESFGVQLSVPITYRRGMHEAVSAMCQLIEQKQRMGYCSPAENQVIRQTSLESMAQLRARTAVREQEFEALKIIEEEHHHRVQVLRSKLRARDLLRNLTVHTEQL